MRVALFFGHPAHFHMLKYVAEGLKVHGHEVFFVIKKKDILETLCQNAGFKYFKIREGRTGSKIGLIRSVLGMEYHMWQFLRRNKIDILIGSTLSFTASKINRISVIAMGEDDADVVPNFAKLVYPFASCVLTPDSCNNGRWDIKSTKYPGFQKLAYLHPKRFSPDRKIVEQYQIDPDRPYFIFRFASLKAHHDVGVQGITTEVAQHLIDILAPHGRILITSERELEPQFEQYRMHINPLDIHHLMAFATLYIGDSQSMAVEAALLGIPSLRFNDFVGKKKIGVMEELEHVYGLTYGISSREPYKLYAKIEELLAMPNLREEWQQRRQRMLADKIDVTAFFTWFIENYPTSVEQAKKANNEKDTSFWQRFK